MLNGFCLAKWIGALIRMDKGARKVERQNRQFVAFAITAATHSTLVGAGAEWTDRLSLAVKSDKFESCAHASF